jgi:hypothetical protein
MYQWEVQAMKSLSLALLAAMILAVWPTNATSVLAQGVHSAAAPMQVWNRTSQGMSTNAALAFYRVQNVGRPAAQVSAWPQYSHNPATVNYPAVANAYYPTADTTTVLSHKPFASIPPPRTAFDRYWPYLLEGHEDPDTGIIIWRLP